MSTHFAARLVTVSLFLLAPFLGGCGGGGADALRSGPETDDYIEEPLREEVKPYENALRVSNQVLDLLKTGDSKTVYEKYLDPRLQAKAPAEQFAKPVEATLKAYGPMKEYKPLQWGFVHGTTPEGMKTIYVTKIVQHERGMLRYHFLFEDDGKYAQLIGIEVKARKGVGPPGPP
ncbi:MAG: hypothetical protein IPJ19_08470 [Planctomycetes bacterium]|nr:hypothetical protein [Planctomycetota bacterium]